jgi:hypothetical protein
MKSTLLYYSGLTLIMAVSAFLPDAAEAQLPRERVELDEPMEDIFWATTNIGISTVRNLSAGSLNSSVLHTFGLVNGGIRKFYGLDEGANTRLGLEYGFTDRFSLGIGRMTFDKVVDFRGKYNILRQTPTDSTPLELAVKLSSGISTFSGMEFSDRLSYFASVMIARKFDTLTLQLSPMLSHFNTVGSDEQNQLFGLGIAVAYELNDRFALSAEYLPVLSERNPGTHNTMAVALNIDTGGHVFQIFFSSSQLHNEQYIMARNEHRLWEGDFRFGFNIHRAFGLR